MSTRSMISFDWAIKRLLRQKANFKILEGFLSELLRRNIIVKYIGEGEGNANDKDDKINRIDIFVEADEAELIIVELQFNDQYDYFQRMLFGVCKAITDYMHKGEPYSSVRKAYSINIVYFDLGVGDDYVYQGFTNFTGLHTKNHLSLNAKQNEQYGKNIPGELYPEYYVIKVNNFDDVAKDTLDEWIYYLKNNKIKDEHKAKGLDKAREVLIYDNLSDEEKKAYEREIEARRINISEIETAMINGRFEGRKEGRIEGRIEGREEGRIEGREEGREERDHLKSEIAEKEDEIERLKAILIKAGINL